MALMMGQLHPDATDGEKIVYGAFERYLPDTYQVWPELPVQGAEERKQPDFVLLHPTWGIIVLEVKDWARILAADPYHVVVKPRKGAEDTRGNPVTQAKRYCDTIADMIRETHREALAEGAFRGPLPKVSRAYAVVLTLQEDYEIPYLEQRLRAKGYLLSKYDLVKARLEARLQSLPRPDGVECLDEDTLELVRRALFPEGDIYDSAGKYIGHFTPEQEIEAKDGVFPRTEEETETDEKVPVEQSTLFSASSPSPVRLDVEKLELTEQGKEIAGRFSVKLVRGVAGSGKTQILCKRAVLLSKLYPAWNILVLTRNKGLAADLRAILKDYPSITVCHFDQLCYRQLEPKGLWRPPVGDQDQPGWIAQVCKDVPGADEFDPRFLRDEFNWMKYVDRLGRESYLAEEREGRETPLPRDKREIVFQTFELFEKRLQLFRQMVWADVPRLMINAIESGLLVTQQYDAILVDEAQMFPPTWFKVVKYWLKQPQGMLFLAADMTQNIYARFSWKQKGINVRGRRTTILRQPYRNSYPIANAAYELVRTDDDLQALLRKDGDELIEPDMDHAGMRPGEMPKLVHCNNLDGELKYVTDEIKRLIAGGCWPSDIAVLTLKEVQGQQRFASHLQAQGVQIVLSSEYRHRADNPRVLVGLTSGITGQEFKAVFVCDLQGLFDRDSTAFSGSWTDFKAEQKRLLYVAMTRARDNLYLCYRQKLHSTLQILEQVTEAVETGSIP
jgi:superfamily I DNA/RNA helicase